MKVETRFVYGGVGTAVFKTPTGVETTFSNGFAGTPPTLTDVFISEDLDNRLEVGTDGGLYVSNDLKPDPLLYYLLERGNM